MQNKILRATHKSTFIEHIQLNLSDRKVLNRPKCYRWEATTHLIFVLESS